MTTHKTLRFTMSITSLVVVFPMPLLTMHLNLPRSSLLTALIRKNDVPFLSYIVDVLAIKSGKSSRFHVMNSSLMGLPVAVHEIVASSLGLTMTFSLVPVMEAATKNASTNQIKCQKPYYFYG